MSAQASWSAWNAESLCCAGKAPTPRRAHDVFTAVNHRQVPELREIVRQADPDAFVVISRATRCRAKGSSR